MIKLLLLICCVLGRHTVLNTEVTWNTVLQTGLVVPKWCKEQLEETWESIQTHRVYWWQPSLDLSWYDQPVRDYFLVFTGNETTEGCVVAGCLKN